jgi:hypothetical protein
LTVTETELDKPAPFVAEQVSLVPAVSAVRVVVEQPLDDAIPDTRSVTLQVTFTLLTYHSSLPGVPAIWGTTIGGVTSILIVVDTELDNPAPFLAKQVRVVPIVLAFSVVGPHPVEDAMPDSGSVTVQVTLTLLRYHPLLPMVPTMFGVTTGRVVSAKATARAAAWLGISVAEKLATLPPMAARL